MFDPAYWHSITRWVAFDYDGRPVNPGDVRLYDPRGRHDDDDVQDEPRPTLDDELDRLLDEHPGF